MLLGHKSRCFDVRVDFSGSRLVSSSEDGTTKLWDLNKRKVLCTLTHDVAAEVLRSVFLSSIDGIVTCGSNGRCIVWTPSSKNKYERKIELLHDADQLYVCELLPREARAQLLTAADELLYMWNLDSPAEPLCKCSFEATTDAAFGGPRNPDNKVYIFDAKLASHMGAETIFAVALSDGSVRIQDLRQLEAPGVSIIPQGKTHFYCRYLHSLNDGMHRHV